MILRHIFARNNHFKISKQWIIHFKQDFGPTSITLQEMVIQFSFICITWNYHYGSIDVQLHYAIQIVTIT